MIGDNNLNKKELTHILKNRLKEKVSAISYNCLIKNITVDYLKENEIIIGVSNPDGFSINLMKNNYSALIKKEIDFITNRDNIILFNRF